MDGSIPSRLTMYLAVKAVCDAKPSVWRRSQAFVEAFADFCRCIEKLVDLSPAIGVFRSVSKAVAVEIKVAETILTMEMDELVEHFENVDVTFVDDYTAARSMEVGDEILGSGRTSA